MQGYEGMSPVMKELDKHGMIHTDCLTVTGETVGENLEPLTTPRFDERGNQQEIDQSLRLVASNEGVKRHCVGTGPKRRVANAA